MHTRDVVLCYPKRTPVGRYGGALKSVPVQELASLVVKTIVEESGIDPTKIDDVILGQGSPNGAAPALGRVAALDAGLPTTVPGMQLDRRCGSGLQAIITAGAHIATGAADVIIAGGAESMSRTEYTVDADVRWGAKGGNMIFRDRLQEAREAAGGKHHPIAGGMIETAENLRREYSIERVAQDELAARSHRNAAAAQEQSLFDAEIIPVTVPQRKGEPIAIDKDEHVRPDSSTDKLSKLRAVMRKEDEEATVTAGNASGQNDGAAAVLVTTREKAEELGLTPMVTLKGWALAGVDPERMGIGPVEASRKVMDRLGITFDDLDLIELNEAFAAQALAVLKEWDISADDPRFNPHGSGISLGHPVGATGARIVVTAAHHLHRTGGKLALVTMCIGGGQGLAAIIEAD